MLSPEQLCSQIEDVQSLYADYLLRVEKVMALDPSADAKEIERHNRQIAALMEAIESRMGRLLPELGQWRQARQRYSNDVNEFIDRFLSLLQRGLDEAQKQTHARAAELIAWRDQIRAGLATVKQQRRAYAGYKPVSRSLPQVIDSRT